METKQSARTLASALLFLGLGLVVVALLLVGLAPWDLDVALGVEDLHDGTFGWLVQEWGGKPLSVLAIGAGAVLAIRAYRTAYPLLARASAALAVQFLALPAVLTNLLKLLSGRPRPLTLGAAGEGFVPWYAWSPGLGDFSFPSGHVAVTMAMTPIVVVLWQGKRRGLALAVAVANAAWALTVAAGRVVYGAHYLTDVTCSIGLGVALAPLSLALGDRFLAWLERRGASTSSPRTTDQT